MFPYHTEPDGNRLAPHHHYTGLTISVGAAVYTVTDPWTAGAIAAWAVGVYGMLFLWQPGYEVFGALVSLAATVAAVLAPLGAALGGSLPAQVALVGGLLAFDDTLQHATGIPTPVDQLWKRYLRERVRST